MHRKPPHPPPWQKQVLFKSYSALFPLFLIRHLPFLCSYESWVPQCLSWAVDRQICTLFPPWLEWLVCVNWWLQCMKDTGQRLEDGNKGQASQSFLSPTRPGQMTPAVVWSTVFQPLAGDPGLRLQEPAPPCIPQAQAYAGFGCLSSPCGFFPLPSPVLSSHRYWSRSSRDPRTAKSNTISYIEIISFFKDRFFSFSCPAPWMCLLLGFPTCYNRIKSSVTGEGIVD